MASMTLLAQCISCMKLFLCNHALVPSIRVDNQGYPDPQGEREPVCKACIDMANRFRQQQGLPPFRYHPDAYEGQECP